MGNETSKNKTNFSQENGVTVVDKVTYRFAVDTQRVEARYLLDYENILGKGAYGTVRTAFDRKKHVERACKEIYLTPQVHIHILFTEFEMMKTLVHPNIIKSYEIFAGHKVASFLVIMDKCLGGDMEKKVKNSKKGEVNEEVAQNWLIQILDGVAYMHSRNILHRDLKPANIMFANEWREPPTISERLSNYFPSSGRSSRSGSKSSMAEYYENVVKICDFGITTYVPPGKLLKDKCGSPAFMSPEMHKVDNKYTPKHLRGYNLTADIWAVGVIMVFILTSKCPFLDDGGRLLKDQLINGQVQLWELGGSIFNGFGNTAHAPSMESTNLMKSLLAVDASQRVTAEEAKRHYWFRTNENMLTQAPFREPLLSTADFSEGPLGNLFAKAKEFREQAKVFGNQAVEEGIRAGKLAAEFGQGVNKEISVAAVNIRESAVQMRDNAQEGFENLRKNLEDAPISKNYIDRAMAHVNLDSEKYREAMSECCVCQEDLGTNWHNRMDYVCQQCKHVTCMECLPMLRKLECPYCRHQDSGMELERILIHGMNAGNKAVNHVAQAVQKIENAPIRYDAGIIRQGSVQRTDFCHLCKNITKWDDFACSKCHMVLCDNCSLPEYSVYFRDDKTTSPDSSQYTLQSRETSRDSHNSGYMQSSPPCTARSSHCTAQSGNSVTSTSLSVTDIGTLKCDEKVGVNQVLGNINHNHRTKPRRSSSKKSLYEQTRNKQIELNQCPSCKDKEHFCREIQTYRTGKLVHNVAVDLFERAQGEFAAADVPGIVRGVKNDVCEATHMVAGITSDMAYAINEIAVEALPNLNELSKDFQDYSRENRNVIYSAQDACTKCRAPVCGTDFACPKCDAGLCGSCSSLSETQEQCLKCGDRNKYPSAIKWYTITANTWGNVQRGFSSLFD